MPLYEYECAKCGKRFEKIEKHSAPRKQKCPHCGGKAERQFSSPAIQFKGSGWYVTDYARKGAAPSASADKPAEKGTAEGKETKEAKETKKESPTKETTKHQKDK